MTRKMRQWPGRWALAFARSKGGVDGLWSKDGGVPGPQETDHAESTLLIFDGEKEAGMIAVACSSATKGRTR